MIKYSRCSPHKQLSIVFLTSISGSLSWGECIVSLIFIFWFFIFERERKQDILNLQFYHLSSYWTWCNHCLPSTLISFQWNCTCTGEKHVWVSAFCGLMREVIENKTNRTKLEWQVLKNDISKLVANGKLIAFWWEIIRVRKKRDNMNRFAERKIKQCVTHF